MNEITEINEIKVSLNGKEKSLKEGCTLNEAIMTLSISDSSYAVAINEQFVPKSSYTSTILQGGDRVELLVPMQGG